MDSSTVLVKQETQEPDILSAKRGFDEEASDSSTKKARNSEGLEYAVPLRFLTPWPSLPPVESPEPLAMAWTVDDHGGDVVVPTRRSVCRQFWKAGDFEADDDLASSSSSSSSSVGLDHVRVHPKFLHSNATSHKWALGALAELLDNSLDEVCNGATYVKVDMLKNEKDGSKMLLVEDDGGGMDPGKMRQCMSFGYSAKSKQANTIGQYGNGFKTSTMRLGADVIVFSRCPGNNMTRPKQTVGMLSYSFLRGTGKEDIVVPMIDYERGDQGWKMMARTDNVDGWTRNLEAIIQWSPYSSEEDLLHQFDSVKEHGTRVVIYSLWEDDQEQLELDFDTDPYDIQIRGVNRDEMNIQMAQQYPNSRHYFTYRHSLRSYASILYLKLPTQFRMILRGKDIEHHNIVNDMMLTKQIRYRPQLDGIMTWHSNNCADVTIGFVKDAHSHIDVQGFIVYHKNRLIKPFWRVWNAAGSGGRGVIGVLEANFVEPAHDKQGFERTTVLSRLEQRLLAMQKSYWSSNCQKVGYVGCASRSYSKKNSKKESSPLNNGSSREESKSIVKLERDAELEERPLENRDQHPTQVNLLNAIHSERERYKSLEASLQSAKQSLEVLNRVQENLLDLICNERIQRDKEEERLMNKLTEAYQTIEDLQEKVRLLEASNGLSCKEEK